MLLTALAGRRHGIGSETLINLWVAKVPSQLVRTYRLRDEARKLRRLLLLYLCAANNAIGRASGTVRKNPDFTDLEGHTLGGVGLNAGRCESSGSHRLLLGDATGKSHTATDHINCLLRA